MLHQNRKFLGALCALLCCLLFHPLAHAENEMGMTWKKQSHYDTLGVDRVGCSGCDAYQGDTPCSTRLPILCLKQDNSPDPGVPILPNGGVMPDDFYNGWAEGHIGLTLPVPGDALMGVEDANDICRFFVGSDYRIGEHHDGKRQSGGYGGWNWYAYGNVNDSSRFWAHVNGQPANCWGNGEGVDSERTDADILALVSPDIKLVNISTRAVIQGGHEDVIAGFIIKGTGKQMVLIRALGEGLGLSPGVDARLTLTKLTGEVIASNEDWENWASPSMPLLLDNWQPPDPSDAALLLNLPAGLYTAIMSSSGAKGIGLVEANAIPFARAKYYFILRYLDDEYSDVVEEAITEIKDELKEARIIISATPNEDKANIKSGNQSGNQFSTASTNDDTFDDVMSESLMLAMPLLPALDSLSCTDDDSCPLDNIQELFTVNNEDEPISISGTDYQYFLDKYTKSLENIDEVSVIEDNEVPDSSDVEQVVNIELATSGQFTLVAFDGSLIETIERIRVLPLPSEESNSKGPTLIFHIQYSRSTFYVWWQFG